MQYVKMKLPVENQLATIIYVLTLALSNIVPKNYTDVSNPYRAD